MQVHGMTLFRPMKGFESVGFAGENNFAGVP